MPNITSFMVGAIADAGTRKDICTALSIPQMTPSLDRIAEAAAKKDEVLEEAKASKTSNTSENSKDEQEIMGTVENMYSHAFLCGLDRNKFGIVKIVLPPEIAKSKLFFTGVTKVQDKPKQKRKRVLR